MADARIGEGQQEGVTGRIVADLADELDARAGVDRAPGDVDRGPAAAGRPLAGIARQDATASR